MVLVGGDLVLYVERGGRTILSFTDDTDTLAAAGKALADAVHSGALGRDVGGAGRRRGGALLTAARRARRRRFPGHPPWPAAARLTVRVTPHPSPNRATRDGRAQPSLASTSL